MATSWPQERAWPTEPREHAANLSRYLRDALVCVERAGDQAVPTNIVKSMILGILSLVTKVQNMPDVQVLKEALDVTQAEARAATQDSKQALQSIKKELQDTKETLSKSITETEESKLAAREATEMGRTATVMLREMKSTGIQNRTVVNIRDPLTVANLKAMGPRNLKAHVDRAIEQSNNEHINKVKAVSANQLRSGDLSIRTARYNRQNLVNKRHPRDRGRIYQELLPERGEDLAAQEIIPPFVKALWWKGPTIHIAKDTETAEKEHQKDLESGRNNLRIYTDGSGIDGHVGAAAACPALRQSKKTYMGKASVSTVYAAELQGIILALQIAQEDRGRGNTREKTILYTDNQAAIRSSAKPKGKPGAYLLKEIARQVQDLRADGLTVEIRWIPAHKGILGNEMADTAAKEATGWKSDGASGQRADPPTELYSFKATLKTWTKAKVKERWKSSWQNETRGRAICRHLPEPTSKVLQLHEGLSKRQSAILVQLRTEKIGLRDFLFNRNVPDIQDPGCHCGEGYQTVAHVLLQCRRFQELRDQELGRIPERGDLRAVLGKRKLAIKAIKFIEQTQILGQFQDHGTSRRS
ncbi:hypothetical protein DL764_010130 [Monosporascus ibericus]|uniref:RNase H type-1 domain-containing protein n=1 Tax=Monosporascus ibericus TaxID=155417 RepID=A0A4Q4STC6_9PEZI|nr:hypothetical protein DL764_010130 [Monosporascus ibericus]